MRVSLIVALVMLPHDVRDDDGGAPGHPLQQSVP